MNNEPYKCVHCGRNLHAKTSHRCGGNIRKRNLVFRDRRSGITYKQGKKWIIKT